MTITTPTREALQRAGAELSNTVEAYQKGSATRAQLQAKTDEVAAMQRAFETGPASTDPAQAALRSLGGSLVITDGNTGIGLAAAVAKSGFDLKSAPSVRLSGSAVFKANVFPAATTLRPIDVANVAPLGQDRRFLWPNLPSTHVGSETAVSDYVQSVRTLTGTVERAVDAATTKANVDVTVAASVEAVKQFAVTINSIPNVVLQSGPSMAAFLGGEGSFQVNKALDAHVLAQIVAATPAFATTGTTTIDKVRNAIAAMRALGASPNVLVINPTDLAAADLFRVGGSAATDGPYAIDVTSGRTSQMWGLQVVERIGGGSDPMYLLDTAMLGHLYVGDLAFEADPYSEFKKNLTTLRIEMNALFHVRNVQGAYRIAAT